MKVTKEFRDKLMAADHAYLENRQLIFSKSVKVPGFGLAAIQDAHPLDTTENFPQLEEAYIPQSVLQALFYVTKEGDDISVFAHRLEKDRKLYLISLHINRNNKTSTTVLTFPLVVVRGK